MPQSRPCSSSRLQSRQCQFVRYEFDRSQFYRITGPITNVPERLKLKSHWNLRSIQAFMIVIQRGTNMPAATDGLILLTRPPISSSPLQTVVPHTSRTTALLQDSVTQSSISLTLVETVAFYLAFGTRNLAFSVYYVIPHLNLSIGIVRRRASWYAILTLG